jgi:hypothetical protein
LKKKYKNKWILAEVLKEDKLHHKVLEIKPLVVSSERNRVYDSLTKLKKGAHVATFYTGPIPKKGTVFAFTIHGQIQV